MKVIIAGSRTLTLNPGELHAYVLKAGLLSKIKEVVSGGARGIDKSGEVWVEAFNISKVKVIPAKWEEHGRAAGPIRNKEMAKYADALLLIWDGKSRGSANMKKQMETLGKPVYEFIVGE